MKITKNVILCWTLIANLPSYHENLILYYTKKISGRWKFWRVLWWIFLWPNCHQIGITFKIMGIECLYNVIGSICIFNFVHSGKSFPKITKPYKIFFSQKFWVQFKKKFQPITSWIMLLIYYFCAETWFAILFTVIIEVVKPEVKGIRYWNKNLD